MNEPTGCPTPDAPPITRLSDRNRQGLWLMATGGALALFAVVSSLVR